MNDTYGISTAFVIVNLGMGSAGVCQLSTVIATLGCGIASLDGKYVSLRLKSMILAESKLNIIMDHISKALADEEMSDDEFQLITMEMEKCGTI